MYIHVDEKMRVGVTEFAEKGGISVPVVEDLELAPIIADGTASDYFSRVVAQVMSKIADAELSAAEGKRVSASILPPDPWLIAIAHVMWNGIVEGMAWDGVKLLAQKALLALQGEGIAPQTAGAQYTRRQLRVRWATYINLGWLAKLYMGLVVESERMTGAELERIPQLDPSRPRKTLRPLNACECGYTWYPKGKDVSLKCPKCGRNRQE